MTITKPCNQFENMHLALVQKPLILSPLVLAINTNFIGLKNVFINWK